MNLEMVKEEKEVRIVIGLGKRAICMKKIAYTKK